MKKPKSELSRRAFVQGTAAALPILSAAGFAHGQTQTAWIGLKKPIQGKIIDQNQQQIPHGTEVETTTQWTGADGKQDIVKQFVQRVDMDDSYVVFMHMASTLRGSYTFLMNGKKGGIEGSTRTDEIDSALILEDGTVQRLPRQITKVRLDHPFQGMSPQETLHELMRMHEAGSRQN
ncbi:MAG TPA: hypothetical protein VMX16_00025 [Terriglobia bacterium]|nr:hypothetical protein [Terriglobia bacterium]